ncbi:MAG: hypothetical protein DMG61_23075, partial [Acidobacteria bacterium]
FAQPDNEALLSNFWKMSGIWTDNKINPVSAGILIVLRGGLVHRARIFLSLHLLIGDHSSRVG